MKKLIGLILLFCMFFVLLLNFPTNISKSKQVESNNHEYASLPGVKVPPLPPKE